MKKHFLSLLLVALVLVSCHTSEKIVYFQDVPLNRPEVIEAVRDITLQPQDQISIIVSSKDPELASLFNLTRAQYRAGYTTMSTEMVRFPDTHSTKTETSTFHNLVRYISED